MFIHIPSNKSPFSLWTTVHTKMYHVSVISLVYWERTFSERVQAYHWHLEAFCSFQMKLFHYMLYSARPQTQPYALIRLNSRKKHNKSEQKLTIFSISQALHTIQVKLWQEGALHHLESLLILKKDLFDLSIEIELALNQHMAWCHMGTEHLHKTESKCKICHNARYNHAQPNQNHITIWGLAPHVQTVLFSVSYSNYNKIICWSRQIPWFKTQILLANTHLDQILIIQQKTAYGVCSSVLVYQQPKLAPSGGHSAQARTDKRNGH